MSSVSLGSLSFTLSLFRAVSSWSCASRDSGEETSLEAMDSLISCSLAKDALYFSSAT